ncbi:MAG: secondary thiamine-phosphate synthase enzyme YjbQ, partial [Chitinivibrionales bacterium]
HGICLVSSLHTTGAITINENADPDVERDFFWKLSQLVPQESAYRHSEGNSDSHVKTSLVGTSVQVPVQNGRVVLGTWQSIYFCEFDGPRSRRVSVTVMGE